MRCNFCDKRRELSVCRVAGRTLALCERHVGYSDKAMDLKFMNWEPDKVGELLKGEKTSWQL